MSGLESLIQSQHLRSETIQSYRSAFESHPGRFVVLEDFLQPDIASRVAEFLGNEAAFETEFGLHSIDHGVSEEEWRSAEEADRFFRFSKISHTPREFQLSDNSLTYLRFRGTFQSNADLRRFFEATTGIELAASDDFGSHSMRAGDFLRTHDDNNRNRRIALVLYLSPDWTPDYGGSLHIVDPAGNGSVVEAQYNSLVVFDTRAGTTHHVAEITEAAGQQPRLTIGGWYHDPG